MDTSDVTLDTLVQHRGRIRRLLLEHSQGDPHITVKLTLPLPFSKKTDLSDDSSPPSPLPVVPVQTASEIPTTETPSSEINLCFTVPHSNSTLLTLLQELDNQISSFSTTTTTSSSASPPSTSATTSSLHSVRILHDEHWVVLSTPLQTLLHWLSSFEFVECILNEEFHFYFDLNDGILRGRAKELFKEGEFYEALTLYKTQLLYFPKVEGQVSEREGKEFTADEGLMWVGWGAIMSNCCLACIRLEKLKQAIKYASDALEKLTPLLSQIQQRSAHLKARFGEVTAGLATTESPESDSIEIELDDLEQAENYCGKSLRKVVYLRARALFQLGMKYSKAVDVAITRKSVSGGVAGAFGASSWGQTLKEAMLKRRNEPDGSDSDSDEETRTGMGMGMGMGMGGRLIDSRYVIATDDPSDQSILTEEDVLRDMKQRSKGQKMPSISLLGDDTDSEDENPEGMAELEKDQARLQAMSLALLRKAAIAFSDVEQSHEMNEQGSAEFDAALNLFHIYGRVPPCCCACRKVSDDLVRTSVLPADLLGLQRKSTDFDEYWESLVEDRFFFFCRECQTKVDDCEARFKSDVLDVHQVDLDAPVEVTPDDLYLRQLACYWFLRACFQMNIYKPFLDPTGVFIRNAVWSFRQRVFPKSVAAKSRRKLSLFLIGEPVEKATKSQVIFNEGIREGREDTFVFLKFADLHLVAVITQGFERKWNAYAELPAAGGLWMMPSLQDRVYPDPLRAAIRSVDEELNLFGG